MLPKISPFFNTIKSSFHGIAKFAGLLTQTLLMAIWLCTKILVIYILKHPYQTIFNIFLIATLLFVAHAAVELKNRIAFESISEQTIKDIMAASSFTRGYDAEKFDSEGERELLDAGAPQWNQHSGIRAVLSHAREAQLSIEHQAVLLTIVEVESGFNPIARAATTSACGLFQFVRATGKRYDLQREKCMNPWLNAKAGIKHYIDNYENRVKSKVATLKGSERVFKTFELSYYIHHDGQASADPEDKVKTVVLRGTPFLFKVYAILEKEQQSKTQTTGMAQYLLTSVRKLANIVITLITESFEPVRAPENT